jgi:chromosome segregation ATPase
MFGNSLSITIDQALIFGLGFLACGVLALIAMSLVHARAVRLTEKKLAFANPVTMKDIQAEKDTMRAGFAMTARRLETSIDELKNKTSAHLDDLARKSNVIVRMKTAIGDRDTQIAQLETANDTLERRVKALFDDLQIARAELGLKTDELAQAERVLAHSRDQVIDLRLAADQRERLLAHRSEEIGALKAHIETVRERIAEFTADAGENEGADLRRIPSPALNGREQP